MSKIVECKGCGRKMGIPIEILTPKSRNQSLFGREIECADCGDKSYYKLSDGDQGNDTLGMGKPDPAVVGGKDLPFTKDSYIGALQASLAGCDIEDQHGEPYCKTHQCGLTDPCLTEGCPHCAEERRVAYESSERAHEIGG